MTHAQPTATTHAHARTARRPIACHVALALLAPLLAGCAGQSPVLSVREAYVYSENPQATVLHVVVDAQNPSDQQIPLKAINYSSRAAVGTFTAQRDAKLVVPGESVQRFEIPVVLPPGADGQITLDGQVSFIPQNRVRELLTDLYPLPTATLAGTTTIQRGQRPPAPPDRNGTIIFFAQRISAPPAPPADTLPPLPSTK
ncbi:MAG: hypothetical protein ACK54T_10690 [bacterium]